MINIGDSLENDIVAAKNAGITTVWVNRKGLSAPGIYDGPDYQAEDLLEVLVYLEGFQDLNWHYRRSALQVLSTHDL